MANNLNKKYKHLFEQISKTSFLRMEGIGNEVPFYITTFKAAEQNEAHQSIAALIKKLEAAGISILEVNLFQLSLEIIQREDDLADLFAMEKTLDKAEFLEEMQSMLDVEGEIAPAIAQKMRNSTHQVLFITGVGAVFPFIRSHTILNNLQKIAKEVPMVLFFPGTYDGVSLSLFDKLKDDNYYRAYNLDNINV